MKLFLQIFCFAVNAVLKTSML